MKAFEIFIEADIEALKKRVQSAMSKTHAEPVDDVISAWGKSADKNDPNYSPGRDPTYVGHEANTSGNAIGQTKAGAHPMNKEFDHVVKNARIEQDITSAFSTLPKKFAKGGMLDQMELQKALIVYANKKYLGGTSDYVKAGVSTIAKEILKKKSSTDVSSK